MPCQCGNCEARRNQRVEYTKTHPAPNKKPALYSIANRWVTTPIGVAS